MSMSGKLDYAGLRCPLCGRADLWAWTTGSVRCCACRSIMPWDWLVDRSGEPRRRVSRVNLPLCRVEDSVTLK